MSSSSSSIDLRNRIIFTIAILAVYRFGTFVPLPGIDPEQLKILMEGNQKGLLQGMKLGITGYSYFNLYAFYICVLMWPQCVPGMQ